MISLFQKIIANYKTYSPLSKNYPNLRKFFMRSAIATFFLWWLFCLPSPLFKTPTSLVLEDASGDLLGARIATDGQWRFPKLDTLPQKYITCLTTFEDKYFFRHFGVNPISLLKATGRNIRRATMLGGSKVNMHGGSTITMQVIRLSSNGAKRNIFNKVLEAFRAMRLELTHSKREILSLYATNAPYGGNIVGLETAAWHYYGKIPKQLSWAECATLAVLPNAPSAINVGKRRESLLNKRNRLLHTLFNQKKIDAVTLELALEEPLPDKPLPLPQRATHLLDFAAKDNDKNKIENARVRTTLDGGLQKNISRILESYKSQLLATNIHNTAAFVIDIERNEVVAYVGNISAGKDYGEDVDIIRSSRSTGSIMKPFLYAWALNDGEILPNSLLLDLPTDIGGYHPENFNETYDGLVPARRALARSLNIPFVRLLNQYGVEKFYHQLPRLGIKTFTETPDHYGLTLILGGGESSLFDLTNAYAGIARTAKHWYTFQNKYAASDWQTSAYKVSGVKNQVSGRNNSPFSTLHSPLMTNAPVLSASACYLTLDAMKEVDRPEGQENWELFTNTKNIAWKTGTSYGFRDAWAIGVTPQYAVGVWVGNANGEGQPGLVGIEKAAPILFDIFNALPQNGTWFDAPFDNMQQVEVCKHSGYRASDLCVRDTVWSTKNAGQVKICPYHRLIHLDPTEKFRVTSACELPQNMKHKPWFVLSALEEFYYRPKNPSYLTLPPMRADCAKTQAHEAPMQFIFPKFFSRIQIPIDIDGKRGSVAFRVAARESSKEIYWHLDSKYVGTTRNFHQIALSPLKGKHTITLINVDGERLEQGFEVL